MIRILNGDLLECEDEVICQGVNCLGVMGAGLALQIRYKWPIVYKSYMKLFNKELLVNGDPLLGECLIVNVSDNKKVACLFTQSKYGRNNNVYINYNSFKKAISYLIDYCIENNIKSIGVPYMIGCGLANGDWNIVYDIIKSVFENKNVICNIYKKEG